MLVSARVANTILINTMLEFIEHKYSLKYYGIANAIQNRFDITFCKINFQKIKKERENAIIILLNYRNEISMY